MAAFDAVVVGAGIIGASVAFRLAERGLRVLVLEKNPAPAMGSTGKSAAGVRVQFSEIANARLSWQSIQEYRTFKERYGFDAGYRPIGYLFLIPAPSWPGWKDAMARVGAIGAPVELLDLESAGGIVPFVADGLGGASFGPADGIIDPHAVTLAYLRLAREHGAVIALSEAFLAARRRDGVWRVETSRGRHEAPIVVNAAGAWAGKVARSAGFELPIEPVRRMVFLTAPATKRAWPMVIDAGSGFYFRPEGPRLLFGRSNPDESPGFREGMDWAWLEPTLEAALFRFPWFEGYALDRKACWWGYYEETPDKNPILGSMPGQEGWFNAAGFSGHGVQQAAAVGEAIASEVLTGHSPELDPFRYQRFLHGRTLGEGAIV